MEKITISLLGTTGTGKTMFLGSLYQTLIADSFDMYSLTGDRNVLEKLHELSLIGRGLEFPLGTDNMNNYNLQLSKGIEDIVDIDLIDYKGGYIEELFSDGNEDNNRDIFFNKLKISDILIVLIDAIDLYEYRNDIDKCREVTKATYINMLFKDLIKNYIDKPLTVLFVLTKTDSSTIDINDKNNKYINLINTALQVYKPTYEIIREKCLNANYNFSIIPVSSIGNDSATYSEKKIDNGYRKKVVITDVKDTPKPFNIDLCILYGIANVLVLENGKIDSIIIKIDKEFKNIEDNIDKINKEIEELSKINNNIFNKNKYNEARLKIDKLNEDKNNLTIEYNKKEKEKEEKVNLYNKYNNYIDNILNNTKVKNSIIYNIGGNNG